MDNIQRNKHYEQRASWTMPRLKFELIKQYAAFALAPFEIAALIVYFVSGGKNIGWFFLLLIIGFIVGTAVGCVMLLRVYLRIHYFELNKIELTEGYSPRLIETAEKYNPNINNASIYLFTGDIEKALFVLNRQDESVYEKNPSGAEMYYAFSLWAYTLRGDMGKAHMIRKKGDYYMHTYMNSPIYGDKICTALAIYEYFCGRYDECLKLLQNAQHILFMEPLKHKNRIPHNNTYCITSYWKAMALACIGNTQDALNTLDRCRELYTTPYYKECMAKLKNDINNNRKENI